MKASGYVFRQEMLDFSFHLQQIHFTWLNVSKCQACVVFPVSVQNLYVSTHIFYHAIVLKA